MSESVQLSTPLPPTPLAQAPWVLKATIWTIPFFSKSHVLPPFARSPSDLEDEFHGGLAMVQLIRYSESPVGPYDELLIVPGKFNAKTVEKGVKNRSLRVSKIFVSTKETCYNGRINWNIPKHLANFKFASASDGSISVEVIPLDSPNGAENTRPFFKAVWRPIRYLPSFPSSTNIASWIGLDLHLVQPPLVDETKASHEDGSDAWWLIGTDKWCKVLPGESSSKTSLGWWDVSQDPSRSAADGARYTDQEAASAEEAGGRLSDDPRYSDFENWWPGWGRWRIGAKMENATVVFGKGEFW